MAVTLKQLEAFYWAATLDTFATAAERLHVSQSSLSKRVIELERIIGCQLFDRSAQRATLTEAGEQMVIRAREVLEITSDLTGRWQPDLRLSGPCRFGISEQAATTWFPRFVDRLRADYSMLIPKPQVGLGRNLERQVWRGELDFAVIAGPASRDGIEGVPVAEVEFEWMTSPRLMPAGGRLDEALLERYPIIVSTTDSGLNAAFEHWLGTSKLKFPHSIVCNSLTAIVGLTVAGQGISFLPRHYVLPLVRRNLLVTLSTDSPFPDVRYSFVSRADDKRRLIVAMRDLLLDEADFRIPNALWTI